MSEPGGVGNPPAHVLFGDVDVGGFVTDLTATSSIEDLSTAEFEIALSRVSVPIDYLAEVRISIGEDLIFTGAVLDSTPHGENVRVRCRAAPSLEELLLPPFAAQNLRAVDNIYLTLKIIGWPDERMELDGLENLPFEPFEVVAPIEGVPLSREAKVGEVRLVPAASVPDVFAELGYGPENEARQKIEPLFRTDAYAIAIEPAARTFDAEHAALRSIDLVLAWLTARSRFGLATSSTGEALRFQRSRILAQPRRGQVAYTKGLNTNRRLIRMLGSALPRDAIVSDEHVDFAAEVLPRNLTLQDQQAILACTRAVVEDDPLATVTALWEAIEFYVAETRARRLFSPQTLLEVRKRVAQAGALSRWRPCERR
jgi:hypothetical protein